MKKHIFLVVTALFISAAITAQVTQQTQAQTQTKAQTQAQTGYKNQGQMTSEQKQIRNEERKALKMQQKEMKMQQKELKTQEASKNREQYMDKEKSATQNKGARKATPQRNAVKTTRRSGPGKK